MSVVKNHRTEPKPGRRFLIDIEGTDYPWHKDTISVSEIRDLGSLTGPEPIVEVDLVENTERTLAEDAVVDVKPGHGFAKKIRFKRG